GGAARAALFGRHGAVGNLQFVADRAGRGDLPCYAVADRALDQPAGAAGRRGGRRGGSVGAWFRLAGAEWGPTTRRGAGRRARAAGSIGSMGQKPKSATSWFIPSLRLPPFPRAGT